MSFDVLGWLQHQWPHGKVSSSGWFRAPCPFHTDSTPSFAVKVSSGNFGCKAAGCGRKGGLALLVKEVEGISWREVFDKIGRPDPFDLGGDVPASKAEEAHPRANAFPHPLVPVSEKRFPSYLRERGYDLTDALAAGLHFGEIGKLRNYVVFPFWDLSGEYRTWTARFMGKRDQFEKMQPDRSIAAYLLYGAWRLASAPDLQRVLVVEGAFDAMRCWKLGIPAVGLSTAAATYAQLNQLRALAEMFDVPVAVALDQGSGEAASAQRIAAGLTALGVAAYPLPLPPGVQDPDGLDSGHLPLILDRCKEEELHFTQTAQRALP